MCRIFAYLGEPISPAPPVLEAEHSLLIQSYRPREMLSGTVNADGFGVVWYHEGQAVRMADDRPIWQASDLAALLRSVRTPAALAVVRSATPGIPIAGGGQPMIAGHHAFAFNGAIDDFRARLMRRLHRALPDDVYTTLGGVSDTEALFRLVEARLREREVRRRSAGSPHMLRARRGRQGCGRASPRCSATANRWSASGMPPQVEQTPSTSPSGRAARPGESCSAPSRSTATRLGGRFPKDRW